jgi:hypothetical protein
VEGCKDGSFCQRNITKTTPLDGGDKHDKFEGSELKSFIHKTSLRHMFDADTPVRLCAACMVSSSHPRTHLRAVRSFSKAGDREVMEFAGELDIWEEHLVSSSRK